MKMKKVIITSLFMLMSLVINAQDQMFKNLGCMCCDRWAEHMKDYGFNLEILPSNKMDEIKNKIGVPKEVRGCHTSMIEGIIVEGHVPADLVHKIIKDRPENIIGIAVPGMPIGSPGMEGTYKEKYEVMIFDSKGKIFLYANR